MKIRYIWMALFFCQIAYSQEITSNKKALKYYNSGLENYQSGKIKEAINDFQESISQDNLFLEPYVQLLQIYSFTNSTALLLGYFEKAANLDQDLKNSTLQKLTFRVCKEFLKQGNYPATLLWGKKALQKEIKQRKELEILVESAKFAQNQLAKSVKTPRKCLESIIKNNYSQYFPSLTADNKYLYFTNISTLNGDENIYQIERLDSLSWSEPKSASLILNSELNEGTASVSADGKTMVFTACNRPNGYGSCDLYISYFNGNDWSRPTNLGENINTHYWESQPALSADGRELYFSSDRKGGIGARDLWRSQKDSTNFWTKASNLGATINTTQEELSPFVHPNGATLFFSSDGHIGMGQSDIFYATKNENRWQKPINLGYPINTSDNEVSWIVSNDGKKAFFSANFPERNGTFLFEYPLPDTLIKKIPASSFLKGIIIEMRTQKKLTDVELEVSVLEEQSRKYKFTSDQKGSFLVVLPKDKITGIFVSKKGYLPKSIEITPKIYEKKEFIISLEPLTVGKKEQLNMLYFDFGKATLREESKIELFKLVHFLEKNPSLKIEIGGHTDDAGSSQANQILSEQRALAVFNFLIDNKIPLERVLAKGYGETQPIISNTSEENRQLNRRIEWKIVSL